MNGTKASPVIETPGLAGYRRIEMDLRQRIAGGLWPVGAMLPSRRDLARQYSVSLVTLDRAIGPLITDGLLRADDRRGTFVVRLSTELEVSLKPVEATREERGGTRSVGRFGSAVRAGTIGIVASVPRVDSQGYVILHELEQILSHRGHSTVVLNRARENAPPLGLAEAITMILRDSVDALVVVCLDIDRTHVAEELSQVDFGGVPTVCILAGEINLAIPHVFYDNRSGGYQAAQHLFERGWKDITVIAPFTASWVTERIAGVRDAVTYAQSAAGRIQVLAGEGREWQINTDPRAIGYQTAKTAFTTGWRPAGGVICVSDGVAFGLLDAAAELGLEAGKDFAVLGFDDEPYTRTRGLTSIRPPMQGMAREAARLLADHVQGIDGSLQVRLRAQVIPRASTNARRD